MNVECDISELHTGVFRASFKLPEPKKPMVDGFSLAPDAIPVTFSPSALYRLESVDISDGWDIEYVQVANVIIPAFRKSPPPLCTPANRITILVVPFRFENGQRTAAKDDGKLVVTGKVFDHKSL